MYMPGVQFLTEPGSDLVINLSPTERILGRTALFCIGEHRCAASHPFFELGGGPHTCHYIGFMRSTVIRAPEDARPEVHGPNTAGFHPIGSSFTRRALDETGEHSEWIAISPAFLIELAGDRIAPAGEWTGRDFPARFAPVSLEAYRAQRHLVEVLRTGTPVDDLAFDEYVARVVSTVVRDAFRFWDRRTNPKRRQRPSCERQRVAIVEAAKQRIATDYRSSYSLARLAGAVNCSPGQLARIFPVHTGFTLHEYQQHCRLRMALQLLRETPSDLCSVAERLGFASHSHFSTVFSRRFGMPPSEFARNHPQILAESLLARMDDTEAGREQRALLTVTRARSSSLPRLVHTSHVKRP
jgi:AraC-like DNA-binding protein